MASPWHHWENEDLILYVNIQPRASKDEIVDDPAGEHLKIRITAPPVDGRANSHLISFLAGVFGVARSHVTILKGETGRRKKLRIRAPGVLPPFLDTHRIS